jgi:hypothetical protein
MKRKQSPISEIFNLFIGYKIFETIISIIILLITYHYFPTPFHFFYNIIINAIK